MKENNKIDQLAMRLADNVLFDELFLTNENSFEYFKNILIEYTKACQKRREKNK